MNSVDPSKIYRLFYPAVPAIVSCTDRGLTYAMPVVSLISLSNSPALVGVSSSAEHMTHQAILNVRSFSVCWLDKSHSRSVEILGTTHASVDKLRAAGLTHSKGRILDVPIIEGCVAALECSLYARQGLGDHELLVGKVQDARAVDDFQDYWKFKSYDPLLYTGIQGGSLKTFEPRTEN